MTSSVVGPRRGTSQSQICTRKRSWSLFGGLLPFWSTTTFWISAKPLHLRIMLIRSMQQKLQCLQPVLVNRKGPILLHNAQLQVIQSMLQKLNKLGYKVLPHLPYSPDLSPTNYHFFKHLDNFLQGKCFSNQQEVEKAFQEFTESWSLDFYTTGKNKHFLLAKMCGL